ncbi:hypothetical protein A3Q33_02830 [Colwellia sp. PAMC 21821]|nr:hypothetical protein A3Q33_02830 [Colwellia sp. PAMC 21821]
MSLFTHYYFIYKCYNAIYISAITPYLYQFHQLEDQIINEIGIIPFINAEQKKPLSKSQWFLYGLLNLKLS